MHRYAFSTALLVVTIDQIIKYTLVTKGIFVSSPFPWLSIGVTKNHGIAFSIPFPSLLLVVLSVVVIVVATALWMRQSAHSRTHAVGFGLFLGGALGNLIDRVAHGYVIDYLNIATGSFNLADVAIIAGLLLLFFSSGLPKQKEGDTMPL